MSWWPYFEKIASMAYIQKQMDNPCLKLRKGGEIHYSFWMVDVSSNLESIKKDPEEKFQDLCEQQKDCLT
jgi:hypothetical protein